MKNWMWVSEPIVASQETVTDLVAQTLVKRWFPEKTPLDIETWRRIARADAEVVVLELIEHGLLKLETEDGRGN